MNIQTGLYVHTPWCVRKCPYCDFNSHPLSGEVPESQYLAAIERDFQHQLQIFFAKPSSLSISTVFFGGGTPSLLSPGFFRQVLAIAQPHLVVNAEVTMEVNPGTREYHSFDDYNDAGINRLSIGAQSFDDSALQTLGRIHAAHEITECFDLARKAGFTNINLDLMHGLPGQTLEGALCDLETAIRLEPEHLSWYQLTIEPKTEFAKRPPLLPLEDVLANVESEGLKVLAANGYERYEISAFAKPDKRCRHNVNYWSFGDYLGVGAGAHGKLTQNAIIRTAKPRQPRLYLRDPVNIEQRSVTADELPAEFMMNALRLIDGVDFATYEQQTGLPFAGIEARNQELIARGLLCSNRLSATPLGLRYLDDLVAAFL